MSNGYDPLEDVVSAGKRKTIQAADTTIPAPAAPADVDPLSKVLADTSFDPLQSVLHPSEASMGDTLAQAESQLQALQTTPLAARPFAQRHPIIQSLIVDPVRQAATAIKFGLIGSSGGMSNISTIGQANLEMYIARLPPDEAQREMDDAIRGSALIYSFAGGPLLRAVPVAGALLGKWGSFLVGEALGGGIYGAVRPTEEDESRSSAVLGDAALFAATGGVFRGAGELGSRAFKRYILALPRARRIAALRAVRKGFDGLDKDLASGGVRLDQLPPEHASILEEGVLRDALRATEPRELDLDALVRAETDKALEPSPRFAQEHGTLDVEPPPGERVLDIPEIPFKQALEQIRPLEVPPKIEPTTRPAGFIEGAALPADEYITAPTVKGHSGKLYVGGATHPETIDQAVTSGVPEAEFAGIDAASENRGFRTNLREFVSRDEAARIVAHGEPLYSEDLHARRLTPYASPAVADLQLEHTAQQALEPREVTPGVLPPKGFEPTAEGAEATGFETQVKELALMDAAVDHAVSRIEPLDIAVPEVRSEAELVHQAIAEPFERGAGTVEVRTILEKALKKEGPAAEEGVVLDLSRPQPYEIDLAKKKTPHEQKEVRRGIEKALAREKAPIDIQPEELITAPWAEDAQPLTRPKDMNGFEIAAHLNDEQLNNLSKSLMDIVRSQGGFAATRLLVGTSGGLMTYLSTSENLSPGEKTGLRALGMFLVAASISPNVAKWVRETGFTRKLVTLYNPTKMMSDLRGPEAFRQYVESMTQSRALATSHSNMIRAIFPNKESQHALMYVLDEGVSAPEFHSLSPSQQQAALALNQINLRLGILLKDHGILSEYRDNYVRHLLPPDSFQRWRTTGFRTLPTGGAFTERRHIETLRELEEWAKKQGVSGPIMEPANVHSYHLAEAYRSLGVVRLKESLERVGLVLDTPKSGFETIPEGWRQLRIAGMGKKLAPDAVAQALENLSNPGASDAAWINSADTVKGYFMRTIMMWPWEHGLNVLRILPAVTMNPLRWSRLGDALKAIRSSDPGVMRAVADGLDLYSRPDYGIRSHDGWQRLMGRVGLPSIGAKIDKFYEFNDRILWNNIVPAIQYFTYATKMHGWMESVGGKFTETERKAAGRRFADFANTAVGRIPQELVDPTLARRMRLMLFSPQWTMSRLGLMAHAAGEVADMAEGKLNPRDALYLPFKMRQLAFGIALTWVGSKILSGQEPEFSPNTSKFYMRTGLRNAQGREIGLDLLGWYQTDLQTLNHPFNFMANRLNPVLKVGYETITGRDYLGRSMTTGQSIGNIISAFGPPTDAASAIARGIESATGGPPITGGEALQRATNILATGNAAVLPRPMDVAIARMAKKLLVQQGIPANDDNIFELSRLLRGNLLNGQSIIDGQVITFLAYRRRGVAVQHPFGTAYNSLWQEGRRVLADF